MKRLILLAVLLASGCTPALTTKEQCAQILEASNFLKLSPPLTSQDAQANIEGYKKLATDTQKANVSEPKLKEIQAKLVDGYSKLSNASAALVEPNKQKEILMAQPDSRERSNQLLVAFEVLASSLSIYNPIFSQSVDDRNELVAFCTTTN